MELIVKLTFNSNFSCDQNNSLVLLWELDK